MDQVKVLLLKLQVHIHECDIITHAIKRMYHYNLLQFLATALQEIQLNSTLIRDRLALPQQQVVFTCVAKNSTVLEWHSDEYIGTGGDSIPIYSIGSRENVTSGGNPSAYATRVSVDVVDGITVIVSKLFIVPTEQFPTSTVTCQINNHGPSKNITFYTTGII